MALAVAAAAAGPAVVAAVVATVRQGMARTMTAAVVWMVMATVAEWVGERNLMASTARWLAGTEGGGSEGRD